MTEIEAYAQQSTSNIEARASSCFLLKRNLRLHLARLHPVSGSSEVGATLGPTPTPPPLTRAAAVDLYYTTTHSAKATVVSIYGL